MHNIEAVAALMVDSSSDMNANAVKAGLTYIGQMISHDIVPPTNALLSTRNVDWALNLSSLYGEQPLYSMRHKPDPWLFSLSGRFDLTTLPAGWDLPRTDSGIALVPEARNDENIIICQLHAFWLRLHNFLLDRHWATDALDARKKVTLAFHYVVIEEFLQQLIKPEVFAHYFREDRRYPLEKIAAIPHYFSHACFRFGHSMVRPEYKLQPGANQISLTELFQPNQPLKSHLIVDWRNFFQTNSDVERAMEIDRGVTAGMSTVPAKSKDTDHKVHIAGANLRAANKAKLSSGIYFVKKINDELHLQPTNTTPITPITEASLGNLAHYYSLENLPLWLYILIEARVQQQGLRLGELGSVLNTHVLVESMAASTFSLFDHGSYQADKVLETMGEFGALLQELKHSSELDIMMGLIDVINE